MHHAPEDASQDSPQHAPQNTQLPVKYTTQLQTIQPLPDRVAQDLEILSKALSTYQNFAHGNNDEHQVII